ncbi:MAG: hypothetical protein HY075_13350 [Deltaproteobacteria bacterium]|nr:hypothetical protein [Deltaproteobacteria bacterium]
MKRTERVACLLLKGKAVPILELAEACHRFSPQIAVRDKEAVFLEIGACRNLYSEQSLLMRLNVLAQRFGCFGQVGFADDAPTALALARFGVSSRDKLPLEALYDYASPFGHDDASYKKVMGLIVTMHMLGLSHLKDFAELPTKTLASRFGSHGVELSLRLHNRAPFAWPRFTPAEKVSEKAELHELSELPICTDLEPLLFVLKGLSDRTMARLRGRAQRLSTFNLTLDLEKGRREWKIELPVPQGSTAGLLPILRDRLGFDLQKKPLENTIVRVQLDVVETTPANRSQRDLFDEGGDTAEAWDALVGRLRQKLGKDSAFVANQVDEYLPERAWARALEALDRLPTELPPRPARVLRKPIPLKQDGQFLVGQKKWRVSEWHGPERIAVEWWMDPELEGFKRDYYRIVTEAGEQLWVYSAPARQGYYLHGYFD